MLRDMEIDLLASRLESLDLASGLPERARAELLDRMRDLERQGYDLISAEGTLELLVREARHPGANPFDVASFEVNTRMVAQAATSSAASVSLRVNGCVFTASRRCRGPLEALDASLRACLGQLYPAVEKVRLTDYRVHILEPHRGTAAKAAVNIEWTDGSSSWTTMGVSENVIEASWTALTGAVKLELLRAAEQDENILCIRDDSWAV